MTAKAAYYAGMAKEGASWVTGSMEKWTDFLASTARHYKYSYPEQLLIFVQRPEATACAEYDFWNDKMNRYIKRGSKGIALVDNSQEEPRVRYVFDVSDTGTRKNSRPVYLWKMQEEYRPAVSKALSEAFGVMESPFLEKEVLNLSEQLAGQYWENHREQIRDIVADSYLEEYDELNVRVAFQRAAASSIAYAVLTRTTEDAGSYFEHEDFQNVFDFNTQAAANVLGTAVSEMSSQVFREIERTIRTYERNKQAERSQNYDRIDVQTERGLSDSGDSAGSDREEAAGEIRQDAPGISAGEQHPPVQSSGADREAVPAPVGDSGHSDLADGAADDAAFGAESGTGQKDTTHEMGAAHEYVESAGGGTGGDGAYQQLNLFSLFPTEAQQIEKIDTAAELPAESAESRQPSAFSISDAEIDHELQYGSGFEGGKIRIYALYQQEGDAKKRADFLKEEYGMGGHSYTFLDGSHGFADHSSKGLFLRSYDHNKEKRVPWTEVDKRLDGLIARGEYLSEAEKVRVEQLEAEYGRLPMPAARFAYPRQQAEEPEQEKTAAEETEDVELEHAEPEDDFSDIDPAAVRRELEERGIVNGQLVDGAPESPFVRQVMADVQELAGGTQGNDLGAEPAQTQGQEQSEAGEAETVSDAPETGTKSVTAPVRDPMLPAYQAGDVVYLDNREYVIDEVGWLDVQMHDASQTFPISRVESRERLEKQLLRDERNKGITDYLTADISRLDGDLRECLTSPGGLLSQEDVNWISDCLRAGEGNEEIGERLSERFAGIAETMQLVTGEDADYFVWKSGFHFNVMDKFSDGVTYSWTEVASVLRTLYQQELDGFSHEADLQLAGEPDMTENVTDFGTEPAQMQGQEQANTEDEGTVPDTPKTGVEIVTEPAITQEKGQETGLRLEPEIPARNFRITDDHLGEGGAKQKFRANIMAIQLLKKCEEEGRNATPEEQQILSNYVGWGGLADAFDEHKDNWATEYLELKVVLTPEEYAAARASTLNAHYTSPTVVKAIYDGVQNLGFTHGNILEPSMGVGNFFGLLPDGMADSRLYGVELDSITGRISKKLYPEAEITVAGFETTDRRDFYDLAVGNVPFGNYKVSDKPYDKLGFSIHNYFFAKALDQVRPGGVVAFVTSRYTMDAKNPDARQYLAQRAELLGAIRLPNNAFRANAGTDVVSDILFLQKREHPIDISPDWVHLGQTQDGFTMNSYFLEHPEMVLGELTAESTQYGKEELTVSPIEGAVLADQLQEAIQNIHGSYEALELTEPDDLTMAHDTIPADPNVKNFSYAVVDGEVYFRENSIMRHVEMSETATGRVKGLVELRQIMGELMDYQLEDYPEEAIKAKQRELEISYDRFTEKYGLINARANAQAFAEDSSYYLLCSLENVDEDGKLESKADIFTKRTIRPEHRITSVDTPAEALAVSIGERGGVDLPYMADLLGTPEQYDAIMTELSGVIFRDPYEASKEDVTKGWHTADDYLSGNVRMKLKAAQLAATTDPQFAANVEALEKAQPKDLDASEIDVRLGATWIERRYIQKFMEETFEPPFYLRRNIEVKFQPMTAEWQITGKSTTGRNDVLAYMTYGTGRANAYKILEDTLNLRDVRIYDTFEDDDGKKKRVLNKKETTLAQQKQQAIKDAFRDWVWKDPRRRQELVETYNEIFNSNRPREYDGSHIRFGGMNPEIGLREHQLNAIAHVLYGGNTLLAHEVGAGKTFEMAASAMEAKRLGLCQKSLFVVPNHLTLQWANEFLRLYPGAKLLVASKKDFETANRKKFCARIATGDYDAVIIGHSQFEKIPISQERQERMLREQIDEIEQALAEMKHQRGENFSIKQMEKTRKSLKTRLDKLLANDRKDDVITFEQLGVDRLFVDEAHAYKNLFLYTKMRNVAGLSTSEAQKSSDMFMKCQYMDEVTGGRGVIFATGTPVSNSMTELYTMMRYLQYSTLQEKGLAHFDCWASTFGETTTAIELAPEGTGYRARTRFAKFFNLPELMGMFKEVADIKTSDQLNLPVPEAKFETVVVKPSEHQQAMVADLSERAAAVHGGSVDPSVDNMLKITSDGRKLGLDQRLMNPLLPDDPDSKLNACVRNVLRIWEEGKEDKLTQLLFCDLSTPKNDGTFNVYEDIKGKLLAAGVPESEVAFIHDADTEAKKKELFAKVRTGQVRVLLGSTQKMGAGTNVQDLLVAVHHLDVGWRPSDMTQRNGRIIRQGNRNKEVQVYQYVTEGTFDAYLYQTLENKQKFISQIMTSKSPVRSCDDVDEQALSYAEIKALCAGDARIREKMDLDVDVARLKLLKADHQSQQYRLEDKLLKFFPAEIEKNKRFISGYQIDMKTVDAHPQVKDGFCGMEIHGQRFAEKADAGEAILAACKAHQSMDAVALGSYRGFTMELSFDSFSKEYALALKGEMTYRVTLGTSALGNLTRLDNALENIPDRIETATHRVEELNAQQEAAKLEVGKPFPQEAELAEKSARLAELDAALNMDEPEAAGEALGADEEERPSVLAELKERAESTPPDRKTGAAYEEVL